MNPEQAKRSRFCISESADSEAPPAPRLCEAHSATPDSCLLNSDQSCLIIPLPFQDLFGGVLLIIELVQSVLHILFFPLPPIFRCSLGVVDLIIVIIFLTFERILSSLPLGVEPVESGVLRVFVILFRPVDRRSLTRLSWRLIDLGIIISLIHFAFHGGSRSRRGTEIDFHHETLTRRHLSDPRLVGKSRGSDYDLMFAGRKNSLDR